MARPPEADLPLFREKRVNDPEKALKLLRVEARSCTRCDLYKNATQTVFGEGPVDASLMLIGEPSSFPEAFALKLSLENSAEPVISETRVSDAVADMSEKSAVPCRDMVFGAIANLVPPETDPVSP